MAYTSTTLRTRPVTREARVPSAITPLERTRLVLAAASWAAAPAVPGAAMSCRAIPSLARMSSASVSSPSVLMPSPASPASPDDGTSAGYGTSTPGSGLASRSGRFRGRPKPGISPSALLARCAPGARPPAGRRCWPAPVPVPAPVPPPAPTPVCPLPERSPSPWPELPAVGLASDPRELICAPQWLVDWVRLAPGRSRRGQRTSVRIGHDRRYLYALADYPDPRNLGEGLRSRPAYRSRLLAVPPVRAANPAPPTPPDAPVPADRCPAPAAR